MRHRCKNKILDRTRAPRRAMLQQLAASVILYEKVRTTRARAKVVRSLVERSITASTHPSVVTRRRLMASLASELSVKKLLEVLGPRYTGHRGGYTRITNIGSRSNDAASMVQIELL
jgi:large subunit ribosomal protein L17